MCSRHEARHMPRLRLAPLRAHPRFRAAVAELLVVRRFRSMTTSPLIRPNPSAAAVLLFLSAYCGGYFWFRQLHTGYISSSPVPLTIIRSNPGDSLFLGLFYPALCLDAKFGRARTFYWLRESKGGFKVDSSHYPFSPFPSFEWRSAANFAPKDPNDVPEELPLISK